MGWSLGYDASWQRDIGYGVPSICDHPDCSVAIDRGLAYVCGGEPYGGSVGCGLYFCYDHLIVFQVSDDGTLKPSKQKCECCCDGQEAYTPKPDTLEWIGWKLTDVSWQGWREENPEKVAELRAKT